MADIELVIKINKDIAQSIIYGENDAPRNVVRAFQATIADAIKNGISLPKGHGRLIDADLLKAKLIYESDIGAEIETYGTDDAIKRIFDNAPTIVEADKDGEEVND